jgi:hypothetical protein
MLASYERMECRLARLSVEMEIGNPHSVFGRSFFGQAAEGRSIIGVVAPRDNLERIVRTRDGQIDRVHRLPRVRRYRCRAASTRQRRLGLESGPA